MDRRWEPVVFALLMSAIMSVAIAFFYPLANGTESKHFLDLWFGGTIIGFSISFPVSLVAVPMVRRIIYRLMD
jgi:hypothetical protein